MEANQSQSDYKEKSVEVLPASQAPLVLEKEPLGK